MNRTLYLLRPLVLIASCAALLWGCVEEEPDTQVFQQREAPVLIEDLPRLSGDYPTELIDGLSAQLIDEVNCIQPGVLVEFDVAEQSGHIYTENYIPHLLRPEVRDAAEGVAALQDDWITITSGYRDVGMQYYDWLWGQRLGFLAARPGSSRHQAGQAIDVEFHSYWRPFLLDYGWVWPYGTDDQPHFEWRENNTPDLRVESVRAFQRLWNRNNSGDTIAEDGAWGMNTEDRMALTQAEGFEIGGCDLDGDGYASETIGGSDCQDDDANVNPGATDVCEDGIDQDCSGSDRVCGMNPDPDPEVDMSDTSTDTVMDPAPQDMTADPGMDAMTDTGGDAMLPDGTADTGGDEASFTAWSQAGQRRDVSTESACGCRTVKDRQSRFPVVAILLLGLLFFARSRSRHAS